MFKISRAILYLCRYHYYYLSISLLITTEIFVSASTSISLDVEPTNTVQDVIDKIDEMKCVNVAYVPPVAKCKARLFLKEKDAPLGHTVELTDKNRTISSYNIQDGSELEFHFGLLSPSEKRTGGVGDCGICSNSLSEPSVSYYKTADIDGLKVAVGSCGNKVRAGLDIIQAYISLS